MNATIISSSSEKIDNYYLSIATSISNYLAQNDFDLVFGACSKSMMGICYNEFLKYNRKIYSYTTEKYASDLLNLNSSYEMICHSTFELKENLYNNSDVIIVLPGGTGTDSEFLSFIEEARSNDRVVPIIVYDEDGFFSPIIDEVIKKKINSGFNNSLILDYFKVTHNKSEFTNEIEKIIYKGKEKRI